MRSLRFAVLWACFWAARAGGRSNSTEPNAEGGCSKVREASLSLEQRCDIAKGDGCGNKYVAAYYCTKSAGSRGLLCMGCIGWLVILFVLLGSTANEFFSPALEQFSADAGLPPRFAGVTLLALGNGAPDVSSTMHAVSGGGYRLALGALTGAGMFVGTVVTGAVMVSSQGDTKAKGALMRDVVAYALACGLVLLFLGHKEQVDFGVVYILLGCYALFVLVVLVADLWHRRPGGPHELQRATQQASDEPPAIELLLTLLHSVRRPDQDLETRSPIHFGEPITPSRAPRGVSALSPSYVVIDGDAPLELGSPFDADREQPLLDSDGGGRPQASGLVAVEVLERCKGHVNAVWAQRWSPAKVLAIIEMPFLLARRASVPLTAEDSYARGPLVVSVCVAPFWLCIYAHRLGFAPFEAHKAPPVALIVTLFGLAGGGAVAHCTKGERGKCSLPKAVNLGLALFGFVVAATWIDVFADELVSTLEFFGVLARIPEPVLGITVLAWGNSVGDFSTNVAMAKKGLGNMAITACFAGPVFNMLVGLGVGFSMYLSEHGVDAARASLNSGLYVGFACIILNCGAIVSTGLVCRGKLPRNFGYASVALYVLYIALSLALLF